MKKLCVLLLVLILLTGLAAVSATAEEVTVNRYCSHCYNWVDWTPLDASVSNVETGHYYLTGHMTSSQKTIKGLVCLDLNGCSITGALTVDSGKTLYCLDSETDDYTIKDGVYGKLTNVTGTVLGLPLESEIADDAYFMITEELADEKKEISFHRIGLQLTAMTLRAESAGVYYKSAFGGDEMVKELVESFGVALSILSEPSEENLDSDCKCTVFTDFQAGGNDTDATSTLLKGVMKETNSMLRNNRNVQRPVYGRAYILLKDGTYLFGASANRSFRKQVEMVNGVWDDLTSIQKMMSTICTHATRKL